ncbi:MAG: hypothetical protein M3Z46_03655 [Actinomycetota bacterium]|nr:hypothetical protein [Actinomycetota bacterium]
MSHLLSSISWDPGFRGVLVVLVGVVVLCGSVFLLLATNTGVRLGFLLALTGLFGWMTIMGITWSMYGIGYKGPTPTWKVLDVNEGNIADTPVAVARSLPEPSQLPDPATVLASSKVLQKEFPPGGKVPVLGDLVTTDTNLADQLKKQTGKWKLLPTSDKAIGETAAVVATELGPDKRNLFALPTDYVISNTFTTGGKPGRSGSSEINRIAHKIRSAITLKNPPAYAVVQLQKALVEVAKPGQAPPVPTADPKAEVISVVLERDLGALRLPSVGFTVVCATMFIICASALHRRDKAVMQARAAVAGAS